MIKLDLNNTVSFKNNVDYCVGTGRMGLALTKEYHDELEFVQKGIGFKYIRGHGLFCDDMNIYHEYEDADGNVKVEYNFTYLDRVFDDYLSLGIRPFLELGFMPYKLASGENYVFVWKGNTTPPKDYALWCDMIKATLKHLIERYGEEEVLSWPIEVWNEPNLWGFWYKADMEEYFKLYTHSANAVKEVDQRFKVGGPAICGGADEKWMRGFLEFCRKEKPPVDFITRHHYCIATPKHDGHYGYPGLFDPEYSLGTLRDVKKIIAEYPEFSSLPFYITEFNTSYSPITPLHDTNENAAYLARTLASIGDYADGYSYWTFGDIFEELGVPYSLFHGGFGLVTNGSIPKPTYWTFNFFKRLGSDCIHRDEKCVVTKKSDGTICGVAWNLTMETNESDLQLEFELPNDDGLCAIIETVDEKVCNPLKLWHDLGEHKNPSLKEIEMIKTAANPLVSSKRLDDNKLTINLSKNAVVYFEIRKSPIESDRGYDYERVIRGENTVHHE